MDLFRNKVVCAPLAGITDKVFRSICKQHGADVLVSEMVSAEGLFYGSKATAGLLAFSETERPIGIQLFGANPDHMARAAEIVVNTVHPDFIDLNSGCPVPKVVGRNGGAALLKDIGLYKEMLRALVGAVSVPITVKIRSGWYEHQWCDIAFAQAAQECGVKALTLHPRSKTMGFSGHSYWERIALVKKELSIPVIGNGDINSAADALEMKNQTGCDSIMIGRATFGNPWIFSQIKQAFSQSPVVLPTPKERVDTALTHLEQSVSEYGEKHALGEMKKHLCWYTKGLNGASALRSHVFKAQKISELRNLLENLSLDI